MSEFTREEAAAFIQAMKLAIEGKVGFRWLAERMSGLEQYIDDLAEENERLRAELDARSSRDSGIK